jgi:cytochrome c peroxidase
MEPLDRAVVNRAFSNVGKAIAAYERMLIPGPSRFDLYVRGVLGRPVAPDSDLNEDERAGLRLFISPASGCVRCHNGPLLTNHGFHNIGLATPPGSSPDYGRLPAVDEVLNHEFNCYSEWSDAQRRQCRELQFIKREGVELPGAFKVPSLRNVAKTAPYMHTGQFQTLEEVLQHYSQPGFGIGHQELSAGDFDALERRQLSAFLATLTSVQAVDPAWIPAAAQRE